MKETKKGWANETCIQQKSRHPIQCA